MRLSRLLERQGQREGVNHVQKKIKQQQHLVDSTMMDTAFSEPIDPNEPRYCYCGDISYGDMIACDNPECEKEWFHLPCTGLAHPPKGKWYCKDCRALMK